MRDLRQKLGGDRDDRYEFARSLGAPLAKREGYRWDVASCVGRSHAKVAAAYHTYRGSDSRVQYPGVALQKGYKLDYHPAVRQTWLRSVSWIDTDGRAWYVAHNHLYLLPRGNWARGEGSLELDGEPIGGIDLAEMAAERGEVFPYLAALLPVDRRLVRDVVARRPVSAKRLMRVRDAHLRGYIAQRCGGLAKIAGRLPLVERTDAGELRDASRIGMTTDVLVVRDSTSGERYALGVPRRSGKQRTVRRALRDLNGIAPSKIVAES